MVDWIGIDKTSGSSGTTKITITASSYTELTARTTSLTVTGKQQPITGTVSITQQPEEVTTGLTVTPTELVFDSTGETLYITITSNAAWTWGVWPDWVGVQDAYLTGGKAGTTTVSIGAVKNSGTTELTGILSVKTYNETVQINCTQKAYTPPQIMESQTDSLDFTSGGGTNVFDVYSNGAWTVVSYPDWLTLSATGGTGVSRPTGKEYVTVTCGENTGDTRIGSIVLKASDENGATKTIYVTQEKALIPTLEVSTDTITFKPIVGETSSFTITCNVDWCIVEYPDWVNVTPMVGSGNTTVTVTYKGDGTKANGSITIQASDGTIATITVKYTNTYLKVISTDDSDIENYGLLFQHNAIIQRKIKIQSNSEWTIGPRNDLDTYESTNKFTAGFSFAFTSGNTHFAQSHTLTGSGNADVTIYYTTPYDWADYGYNNYKMYSIKNDDDEILIKFNVGNYYSTSSYPDTSAVITFNKKNGKYAHYERRDASWYFSIPLYLRGITDDEILQTTTWLDIGFGNESWALIVDDLGELNEVLEGTRIFKPIHIMGWDEASINFTYTQEDYHNYRISIRNERIINSDDYDIIIQAENSDEIEFKFYLDENLTNEIDSLSLSYEATSSQLYVTSNSPWSCKSSSPWFNVTTTGDSGTTRISIFNKDNEYTHTKFDYPITFYNQSGQSATLNVMFQPRISLKFTYFNDTTTSSGLNVPLEGTNKIILSVITNIKWTLIHKPDWMEFYEGLVNQTSGNPTHMSTTKYQETFYMYFTVSSSSTEREDYIRVGGYDYFTDCKLTIPVTQSGSKFEDLSFLSLSPQGYVITGNSQTDNVIYIQRSYDNDDIKLKKPSWVVVYHNNEKINDYSSIGNIGYCNDYHLKFKKLTSGSEEDGTITVSNTDGTFSETIYIKRVEDD